MVSSACDGKLKVWLAAGGLCVATRVTGTPPSNSFDSGKGLARGSFSPDGDRLYVPAGNKVCDFAFQTQDIFYSAPIFRCEEKC